MTQDTYSKSRARLEENISMTADGGSIRIRKDDLQEVLSRLDEVGQDSFTDHTEQEADAKAAANAYSKSAGYRGSVEALGTANAFYFGAINEGSAARQKLIDAFTAGLDWNAGEGPLGEVHK